MKKRASITLAGILVLALSLLGAGPAAAETTHKLIESWPTGLAQPEVGGVDFQGNVYVFDDATKAVYKYDDEGNEVDFSGLGSNVIDGKGGFECATVPADCDRVPTGGLTGSNGFNNGEGQIAVDPRASGPAAGYIYVVNSSLTPQPGNTEVFAPSGKFVGELDRTVTFPGKCVGNCLMNNVSVDSQGSVYQAYCCGSEVDQWSPVDGNPAHNIFVGQLRAPGLGGWTFAAGGFPYTYGLGEDWQKYDLASFLTPRGATLPIDFSPAPGPWGDGGHFPNGSNTRYPSASVDPHTQDVYLHGLGGNIEQWNEDNEKVGPNFGETTPGAAGVTAMGFHPDGRLFMTGSENAGTSVAVYSGPVPIPDITYSAPEVGHDEVIVHGHVDLAGGPEVETCEIEYGAGVDGFGNPTYGSSVPCDPATPFAAATDVSATLSGLTTETLYHYRIVAGNDNGVSPGADRTAKPAAVLGLTAKPATDVTRTSATLNAGLDTDGIPTTYHFEYGLDTEYDTSTPETAAPEGAVDVSTGLTQLQSGRIYHYRIVAKNSLGTSFSQDATFQAARSPAIAGVRGTNLTESTADINARINPSGYETTYYFEYGPTPSYGTVTPASPESIGDGLEEVPVTAHLEGLTPGVEYHFRVLATNQWGTSSSEDTTLRFFPALCPNEHVRQQTGSNHVPDCRAYELVSPASAGAVQLFPSSVTTEMGAGYGLGDEPGYSVTPQNTGLATGPSRFAFFGGIGSIAGLDTPNSLIDMYVSSRTNTGWVTTFPGRKGSEVLTLARPQCSSSLGFCIIREAPELLGPGEQDLKNSPFVYTADGTPQGRWPTNVGAVPDGTNFEGDGKASGDFSTFAFSSRDKAYAPGGLAAAPGSVYDNDIGARTLAIASKMPDGTDIQQDGGDAEEFLRIPSISSDGSHILISSQASDGPVHLYMRVGASVTYDITKGTGATFIGMTLDGSRVVFASNHRLTADDTDTSADIYQWSEDTKALTRVSAGTGAGNSDACNASYTSQCSAEPVSPERGRTQFGEPGLDDYIGDGTGGVYFFSPEQLDPVNPGIANQRNLYVYRDGALEYVTTLDPGTTVNRIQISPDAGHAAFITAAQLTDYDNNGFRQMYIFDADRGTLFCASCNPSGMPPTGNVLGSAGGPFMTDDGRAFFNSPDPLDPQDSNGLMDVYEYVEGQPQLITTGTADKDLYAGGEFFPKQFTGLESVSADGGDVYFSTFDTLVADDINGEYVKFYDARTNGGFPQNPGLQPCTAADECAGQASRPPAEPLISTGTQLNRGQVPSPKNKSKKKSKAKKKKKKKKQKRNKKRAANKHKHGSAHAGTGRTR